MSEWTNEMSDKAIKTLMERCGMLQNKTLYDELKQLENTMSQAFKPTWGGPNDPDVLRLQIDKHEQFRAEIQAICENGKYRTQHTQRQMCKFLDDIRYKALASKADQTAPIKEAPGLGQRLGGCDEQR